ncbi:MAG: L-lactate permease, partial [Clostridiales Family XIII bacterium]|nr:L-lactate permease [Clostridiales Family XIII bacterium]
MMKGDLLFFVFGILPILWLFFSLCLLRLPGRAACPSALAICAALAVALWGMTPGETVSAAAEGVLFALWPIILVIVAALILYKYSIHTGGMEIIKGMLAGASTDKRVLALLLAWGFGGFLEGVAGFGTPVLIPGGILIAMGFPPFAAVVVCLIANTAPTAFATLGVPLLTLADVTGLNARTLGFFTALQIAPLCLIVPFLIVCAAGKSVKAIKGVFLITLFSGLAFLLPILLLTAVAAPELPTLIGGLLSIVTIIVSNKLLYRDTVH